jgi:hypothetical protein
MNRCFLFIMICCSLAGCGEQESGKLRISGNVTFEGKPVQRGRIDFRPDVLKGNKGAAGFALIENGSYDTAKDGGDVIPGALVAVIQGYYFEDGVAEVPENAKPLFRTYETTFDAEYGRAEQYDFEIPKTL